jgi:hypothetical protein
MQGRDSAKASNLSRRRQERVHGLVVFSVIVSLRKEVMGFVGEWERKCDFFSAIVLSSGELWFEI